ncbi:hypothetical protein C8J56DRAFT_420767 [Mycena floridula]|nr:hypothetical protein C8J56DRAFT_420767 [Mycena floridula]
MSSITSTMTSLLVPCFGALAISIAIFMYLDNINFHRKAREIEEANRKAAAKAEAEAAEAECKRSESLANEKAARKNKKPVRKLLRRLSSFMVKPEDEEISPVNIEFEEPFLALARGCTIIPSIAPDALELSSSTSIAPQIVVVPPSSTQETETPKIDAIGEAISGAVDVWVSSEPTTALGIWVSDDDNASVLSGESTVIPSDYSTPTTSIMEIPQVVTNEVFFNEVPSIEAPMPTSKAQKRSSLLRPFRASLKAVKSTSDPSQTPSFLKSVKSILQPKASEPTVAVEKKHKRVSRILRLGTQDEIFGKTKS